MTVVGTYIVNNIDIYIYLVNILDVVENLDMW